MIYVLTKRTKCNVEDHRFQNLTDGQLSYWELPHVLGDKIMINNRSVSNVKVFIF